VRRLRYQVATSLDAYIAGPNGEFDWIATDPDIDFAALFAQFDTAVMGRKTFLACFSRAGARISGCSAAVDYSARRSSLSVDDAAYLGLAQRRKLVLGCENGPLREAARRCRVGLWR
jgi:hypothetical protein